MDQARTSKAREVEDEPRRSQDDLVARGEPRALDPAPVHLDPVRRAEVDDLPVPRRAAAQLGVAAGDVGVAKHAVALVGAAENADRAIEHVATVVHRDDGAGLDQPCARLAALLLASLLLGSGVHHRLPLLSLLRLLALARRRLHEPRLDPELAEPQPLVGLQRDLRPGQ
jgi:hypothetical protein